MSSRNKWVKMVLGTVVLAALLMPSLAQAQVINTSTTLTVFVAPQAAMLAGGQWRIVGDPVFQDSGSTQVGLTSGSTTANIEFLDIPGWIAPVPNPVTIPIVQNEANVTTGTYTRPTALQIVVQPFGVIALGAKWRPVGIPGPFLDSGVVLPVPAGTYDVEFTTITGWDTPANLVGLVVADGTTTGTGTYVLTTTVTTAVRVFIHPDAAVAGGAQWQIQGETVFHNSGDIVSGLTAGSVVIVFSVVDGWTAPANETVTIVTGQTTPVDAIYTIVPLTTGLRVHIDPTSATLAGAKWRFVSLTTTTLFVNSDFTITGLTSGSGTVQFSPVSGWVTPANLNVTISAGWIIPVSGTYTLQLPAVTGLQVFIQPVGIGGGWRIVGDADPSFHSIGFVEAGLTSGPAVVTFKPIAGWIAPANQDVAILTGQIVVTTGTYVALPPATALQVFIQPTSATAAGVQWRVVSATTTTLFLNSGATATGLTSGPAVVQFSPLSGWVTPADQNVAILTNQTVVTTGTYTLMSPVVTALQVFIAPAAAANAGAQWRRVGTTTFFSSGFIETGLTAGPAVVEFNSIIGWVSPPNQNVTIVAAQIAVTTGTYAAAGSLQVMIDPASAVAAGAQWRPVGTVPYFNSGDTEPVVAGTYAVEFKAIAGFAVPANLTGLVVVAGATTTGTGTYTVAVGAPGNYKISYKNCTVALDTTTPGAATGLIVTGASAATIKIQKLTKLPKKHNDVAGKTLFLLNSPGLAFLDAETGTIKSLSGTGAFIPTITANVTGSIKMGVAAVIPSIPKPATSIKLPGIASDAPRAAVPTLKVALTGVSLRGLATNPSSAAAVAIKISAKKVKGATIPAGVSAGAKILVGQGLSLAVIGGNIYADLIQSQGGIKSLSVKGNPQFSGGNIGADPATPTSTTLATLDDTLTSPTVAVLLHPSTPVVVSLTSGFGKISGSNVDGVFVAGANLVNGLVHPTCSAAVKTWKATNASGDVFISAPAKSQPAGIVAHTTAP